jgi:fatty-acid peroxygenase
VVAATELLNIVRPTVAVAYFGAYAAQALAGNPSWRDRLADGDPDALRAFEHEIRRWYPFAPLLTGRLRRTYEAAGVRLRRRSWMVLDILGTNRDPRLWDRPDEFDPSRFLPREPTGYDYVPQGGGDPAHGHRCPGEPLAASILTVTLQRLARLEYVLSEPSRTVPLDRIPSLPPDRLTLTEIRSTRTSTDAAARKPGS